MGTTYLVVNTTKRQYFDPGQMGNSKYSGLLHGIGGHALAVLLFPREKCRAGFLIESWAGDSLYIIGDEPEEKPFPGLARSADESRSAYEVVTQEYDEITLNLIASILGDYGVLDWYLEQADKHDHYFLTLANIVLYVDPEFARLFEQRYGKGWPRRYQKALQACAEHCPMPMTQENRKNMRTVACRP
jgi:hypothetical protein